MKPTFLAFILSAFMIASCSGNSAPEEAQGTGTHQHEDGSTHQDHDAQTGTQEEFSVKSDTLSGKTKSDTEHTHDGQVHTHTH